MPNILFIDTVCPAPYDPEVLATRGLGGSEATVVRVAERLAKDICATAGGLVAVAQRGRRRLTKCEAVYVPFVRQWRYVMWDAVVVFRQPAALAGAHALFPRARLVLWLEDLADARLFHPAIEATQLLIVTVSAFHRQNVIEWLNQRPPNPFPTVVDIFNPIDDDLCPDLTPIDRDKLVFLSSPNKGLDWTIEVFRKARRKNPAFQLYVANPAYRYRQRPEPLPDGVGDLGVLSHTRVMQHVRESLCVFYLNRVYPETSAACSRKPTPSVRPC